MERSECQDSLLGVWRSWLARAVWDREVEGSSPFTPTTLILFEHAPSEFHSEGVFVDVTGVRQIVLMKSLKKGFLLKERVCRPLSSDF